MGRPSRFRGDITVQIVSHQFTWMTPGRRFSLRTGSNARRRHMWTHFSAGAAAGATRMGWRAISRGVVGTCDRASRWLRRSISGWTVPMPTPGWLLIWLF